MDYKESKVRDIIRETVFSGIQTFQRHLVESGKLKETQNPYAAVQHQENLNYDVNKIVTNAVHNLERVGVL